MLKVKNLQVSLNYSDYLNKIFLDHDAQMLKTWQIGQKQIRIYQISQRELIALICINGKVKIINDSNITGIDDSIKKLDCDVVKKYIQNTFVKLNPLSTGEYYLHILQQIHGGGMGFSHPHSDSSHPYSDHPRLDYSHTSSDLNVIIDDFINDLNNTIDKLNDCDKQNECLLSLLLSLKEQYDAINARLSKKKSSSQNKEEIKEDQIFEEIRLLSAKIDNMKIQEQKEKLDKEFQELKKDLRSKQHLEKLTHFTKDRFSKYRELCEFYTAQIKFLIEEIEKKIKDIKNQINEVKYPSQTITTRCLGSSSSDSRKSKWSKVENIYLTINALFQYNIFEIKSNLKKTLSEIDEQNSNLKKKINSKAEELTKQRCDAIDTQLTIDKKNIESKLKDNIKKLEEEKEQKKREILKDLEKKSQIAIDEMCKELHKLEEKLIKAKIQNKKENPENLTSIQENTKEIQVDQDMEQIKTYENSEHVQNIESNEQSSKEEQIKQDIIIFFENLKNKREKIFNLIETHSDIFSSDDQGLKDVFLLLLDKLRKMQNINRDLEDIFSRINYFLISYKAHSSTLSSEKIIDKIKKINFDQPNASDLIMQLLPQQV